MRPLQTRDPRLHISRSILRGQSASLELQTTLVVDLWLQTTLETFRNVPKHRNPNYPCARGNACAVLSRHFEATDRGCGFSAAQEARSLQCCQVFQPPAADPEAFNIVIRRPDGTEEIWKRHVSDSEARDSHRHLQQCPDRSQGLHAHLPLPFAGLTGAFRVDDCGGC